MSSLIYRSQADATACPHCEENSESFRKVSGSRDMLDFHLHPITPKYTAYVLWMPKDKLCPL